MLRLAAPRLGPRLSPIIGGILLALGLMGVACNEPESLTRSAASIGGGGFGGGGLGGSDVAGAGGTVNGCDRANWTFTPQYTCDYPGNGNCNFDINQRAPAGAIDGLANTRYTDGRTQAGGEYVIVSFAGKVKLSGMNVMTTTGGDGAKAYRLEYSTDGTTFTVFTPAIAAVGGDNLMIPFPATTLKAIKMVQTGMAVAPAINWWSIHEITFTGCTPQ
jgi:hypothetical protein